MPAVNSFATDGICVCDAVVPASLTAQLASLPVFAAGGKPGARAFAAGPEVSGLIQDGGALRRLADDLMGAPTRAVRMLGFDKTPEANWAVPWHQDRTIAVAERIEVEGFGPWSVKAGVHHVEPPEAVLRDIVSLRLHLDDCGPYNGPLLALRGSMKLGRVAQDQITRHVDKGPVAMCCAKVGDVVAMRGLTLHASERAAWPSHRRVLHIDFSAGDLPGGLTWALA